MLKLTIEKTAGVPTLGSRQKIYDYVLTQIAPMCHVERSNMAEAADYAAEQEEQGLKRREDLFEVKT